MAARAETMTQTTTQTMTEMTMGTMTGKKLPPMTCGAAQTALPPRSRAEKQ